MASFNACRVRKYLVETPRPVAKSRPYLDTPEI